MVLLANRKISSLKKEILKSYSGINPGKFEWFIPLKAAISREIYTRQKRRFKQVLNSVSLSRAHNEKSLAENFQKVYIRFFFRRNSNFSN